MKKFLTLILVISLILIPGCGNNKSVTVSVEIDCSDILLNYDMLDENLRDEKYVPENGLILEKYEISVREGDSAIEALKAACKEKNIPVDVSSGYAKGINCIYEKSCGDLSGWVYEVNGQAVMTEYSATEGDTITWKYICDFSTFSFSE